MNAKLKIALIAAWIAFILAMVIRVSLGAGNILVVMTGIIALNVTAIAVTRNKAI